MTTAPRWLFTARTSCPADFSCRKKNPGVQGGEAPGLRIPGLGKPGWRNSRSVSTNGSVEPTTHVRWKATCYLLNILTLSASLLFKRSLTLVTDYYSPFLRQLNSASPPEKCLFSVDYHSLRNSLIKSPETRLSGLRPSSRRYRYRRPAAPTSWRRTPCADQ